VSQLARVPVSNVVSVVGGLLTVSIAWLEGDAVEGPFTNKIIQDVSYSLRFVRKEKLITINIPKST
jgi:hypothetical protein